MSRFHHRIRIKEPTTKLPKHLDKESFLNAVSRGEIPIKIPNSSNAYDEYLKNFNGIAKYCSFRHNQSQRNPELFTWTLKQQQFHPIEVPKVFLAKTKKSHSMPKKPIVEPTMLESINSPSQQRLLRDNPKKAGLGVLNPPKRIQVYNAHMYSEKEIKKMEREEKEYEEKIKGLIKSKWEDIYKNADALRHRKIFSITKMQNDALNDEKDADFMETMVIDSDTGMSLQSQKSHFLNPFDKKNFGINKIIHYIKEKDEEEEVKMQNSTLMQSTMRFMNSRRKHSFQKFGDSKERKLDELLELTGSGTRISKKNGRTRSYVQELEKKLENALKINNEPLIDKTKTLKTSQSQKTLVGEDNILNYNAYFSKRYYNTGFRLELSEKGRKTVRNFEDNLRKSIENFDTQKISESGMNKIEENEDNSA